MRIRKLTLGQREEARRLRFEEDVPRKIIAWRLGVSIRGLDWHLYPKIRERERERRAACQ